MELATMNKAQMMILESFAGVSSQKELSGLMHTLKMFYADLLDQEMLRIWNDGTLNQEKLDELKQEHFRTAYSPL